MRRVELRDPEHRVTGAPVRHGVADGETRADREFGLDSVACMGACSQAPVMRIDDDTYGNLSADETRKIARKLLETVAAAQKGGSDA